jgi:glycerophosphoryl diester phosphodiesterase
MHPVLIALLILLAISAALFAIYLFLICPGKRRDTAPFCHTKFAHRGLHNIAEGVPENSPAAIRLAREAGYGVEWDIQFTADKQIVVFHDATLTRMCGVDKRVDELTYEQLQKLTLQGSDQHIPLLSEALELLGDAPLVCEIKSHGAFTDTSLCEAAWPILSSHTGPWCIESFNPLMVRWFRIHHPEVIRGYLSCRFTQEKDLPPWMRWLLRSLVTHVLSRPDFVAFAYTDWRSASLRLCRLFKPLCIAWTPRDAAAGADAMEHFDTIIFEGFCPEN